MRHSFKRELTSHCCCQIPLFSCLHARLHFLYHLRMFLAASNSDLNHKDIYHYLTRLSRSWWSGDCSHSSMMSSKTQVLSIFLLTFLSMMAFGHRLGGSWSQDGCLYIDSREESFFLRLFLLIIKQFSQSLLGESFIAQNVVSWPLRAVRENAKGGYWVAPCQCLPNHLLRNPCTKLEKFQHSASRVLWRKNRDDLLSITCSCCLNRALNASSEDLHRGSFHILEKGKKHIC